MARRRLAHVAAALCWLLSVSWSSANADIIEFDLSKSSGTTTTETVNPGTYTIRVVNALPGRSYDRQVIRTNQTVPALDNLPNLSPLVNKADTSLCEKTLAQLTDGFTKLASEDSVATFISSAPKRFPDSCPSDAFVAAIRQASSFHFDVSITGGEDVTITLSRARGSGGRVAWTLALKTKPRGTWLTTYGPAIIPNRDETFWLSPTSNGDFVVARQHKNEDELKALPAIFFTWLPSERELGSYAIGPTAGLGAGTSGFSAFLGAAWLYNWNLQFSAGVSAFQVRRLAGPYAVGDTVKTNLTDDQLHRTTVWPGWFAALTLRFGGNPYQATAADTTKVKK